MAHPPVPSSGVLGAAGRVTEPGPVRSADLRLAGASAAGARHRPHLHLRHHALRRHARRTRGDVRLGGRLVASAGARDKIEALVGGRNVTDVDDVLTYAAWTRGRRYDELALTQEFLFDRDMKSLARGGRPRSPRTRVPTSPRRSGLRLPALLDAGAGLRGRAASSTTEWRRRAGAAGWTPERR